MVLGLALPALWSQSPLRFPETWTPANPRYAFQPVAERFDISTATVTAIAQDHAGFLWMGTQQGVLRYDGGSIVRFGREDGLPTLFIDQLETASDGAIWVGTNDGIARYNGTTFERIPIPVAGARFDSSYQIIAPDRADGVYVGTSFGLLRLDRRNPSKYRLWTRKDRLPSDAVEAVFLAAGGDLYFTCGNHVGRLRDSSAAPEILAPPITGDAAEKVIAILMDAERVIWVRTASHVMRLEPGASRFTQDDAGIPMANDFGIPVLDGSGQLMVPTVRGLFRRNHGHWEQVGARQGMDSDAVFAAREDREGAIWVGYGGSGVARWPGTRSWSAWTKSEGLPDNVVWCEMRDAQGRLWVGTDNGLAMWDPRARRWHTYTEKDGLAGATVRQLALGHDGTIWTVSVPEGVSRIDSRTLQAIPTPMPAGAGDASGIGLAPDGRIWAGNSRTLKIMSFERGRVAFEDVQVPAEAKGTTSHPAFAPDGALWSSGRNGISRFDGTNWAVYTTAQGLRANVVPMVLPVSANETWFRYVEPLGLGHLRLTEQGAEVKHLTTKEGMAADSVFLLGSDHDGRVWAGGNEGLNVVEPSGSVHTFTRGDGLIWNDLSAGSFWSDPDGSVYIGTSRGLARFQTSATGFNYPQTDVLLTSVKLGGIERLNDQDPHTAYSNRTFTAQFADLSFRDAEKTPCRYRMEGVGTEFLETLQREARYVSLPSGSYRFQVSCQESGGS